MNNLYSVMEIKKVIKITLHTKINGADWSGKIDAPRPSHVFLLH